MRKSIFFLVVFFLSTAFLVFALFRRTSESEDPHVRIGNALFSVEIADTEKKQSLGLGRRSSLCDTCGMLFVFNHADERDFWMKDMRFPLDILWIRDGKIVHIERSVDFHDQNEIYRSPQPADRVLEINADVCMRLGIGEGDSAVLER